MNEQAWREPNDFDKRCESCLTKMIGIIIAYGREPRKVCVKCQEDYNLDHMGAKRK